MNGWGIGVTLLLAGCTTAGNWNKPGVETSAAAHEYEDCRAAARTAVKPEIGIDEDIRATRHADIGRSSFGRIEARNMRDETRDREDRIVASCMKAKGFTAGPAPALQPRR